MGAQRRGQGPLCPRPLVTLGSDLEQLALAASLHDKTRAKGNASIFEEEVCLSTSTPLIPTKACRILRGNSTNRRAPYKALTLSLNRSLAAEKMKSKSELMRASAFPFCPANAIAMISALTI